jgi:carboxyl-terminal processing protease
LAAAGLSPMFLSRSKANTVKKAWYIMQQSGIVGHFAFEQIDKNRKLFKGLSFAQFLKQMNQTDLYFNNFHKYLLDNGVNLNMANNKALVKRYIAAEFARQLFDEQKYYEIVLKEDPMVKAVLSAK